jgi:phage baseplate assembly protein V
MPGIIESFDPATQLATVQPAIRRVFKTDTGDAEILTPRALPLLINVPVSYPKAGGFSLTFPVATGDECLLCFCERSIDGWHEFGGVYDPTSRRFHDLSDAVALLGISSKPKKDTNYSATDVQLKHDDGTVSLALKPAGDLEILAVGDIEVTATAGRIKAIAGIEADVTAPVINLNGAVNISGLCTMSGGFTSSGGTGGSVDGGLGVTGALTNNGVNVGSTHSHNQGNDSAGNSQQPVGAPF